MEVMEVLMAAVAGAVGEDLEVVVAADMIAVLTEVAEVDKEEEEAWEWAIVEDSISLVDQENWDMDMEDPVSCRTRITLIITPSSYKAWVTTTLLNQWQTFLSRLGSLRSTRRQVCP